jgi:hypothetical protein
MTVVRRGGVLLHEDRTCALPACGALQPVGAAEVDLPRQATAMRTRAEALEAEATRLRHQADALDAEVAAFEPRPWLCSGHRLRIYAPALVQQWAGGYLGADPHSELGQQVLTDTLDDIAAHHVPRGTRGAGVYR